MSDIAATSTRLRRRQRRRAAAIRQECWFAARSVARRPALSAAVIATLALGIGANTAVFRLMDAVVLRPLSVARQESLVAVFSEPNPRLLREGVAYPTYRDFVRATTTVTGLAAYMDRDAVLHLPDHAEQVTSCVVSGNYFTVLGIRPAIGRLIQPADEGAPFVSPVVVLSDPLWERAFDRDPAVIGRAIGIGTVSLTIVGVAPATFRGTTLETSPDVWVPVSMIQGLGMGAMFSGRFSQTILTTFRGYGWLQLVGRVRRGATPEAVTSEFTQTLGRITKTTGGQDATFTPKMTAMPLSEAAGTADRATVVRFITLLLGVVALVLLLGCANVANLLLVRAAERTRELSLHAALGASRGRLLGRLLLESLWLALAGGVAGLGLGAGLIRLLTAFSLPGHIRVDSLDLSLDGRVLVVTLVLSVCTTIVFGVWPAVRASRSELTGTLRSRGRSTSSIGPQRTLIAVQVTISLTILVAASLFVRSLRAGLETGLGFDPETLAAATIQPSLQGYETTRLRELYRQLADRLGAQPGVEAAAVAFHVPLAPNFPFPMRPAGSGAPVNASLTPVSTNYVTPGYFATLRVPIVAGRDFTPTESDRVILNESAARALWPGVDAVGRQVIDQFDRTYTVIGTVRDTKYESLIDQNVPYAFLSILQEPVAKASLIARGRNVDATLAQTVAAIKSVDSKLPILEPRRVTDQVSAILMPQRFGATLLVVFAVIAAGIATVGVYATLAYVVAQRRLEIGIRMALGARPSDVARAVLVRTALALASGLIGGLVMAAATARALEHFLVGIGAFDVPSFAGATALLATVVGAFAMIPARRATQIDPATAIRTE